MTARVSVTLIAGAVATLAGSDPRAAQAQRSAGRPNIFADLKQASAERCPKELGTLVKQAEVQFHHEVTNQHLWNTFLGGRVSTHRDATEPLWPVASFFFAPLSASPTILARDG